MSANERAQSPPIIDKGKQRAQVSPPPSERTPLLAHSSAGRLVEEVVAPHNNRRLWRKLTTVFFLSLIVCVVVFVGIVLLAWTYASRATNLDPQDVIRRDLVLRGPDKFDVLNVTDDGGVWINIKGKVGMDAGRALGVGGEMDDSFFKDLWKALGRWGVRTLDRVTVDLKDVQIAPDYDAKLVLVEFDVPPMEVKLTADPPRDDSWLESVSLDVLVHPTKNRTEILRFVKESWKRSSLSIRANVGKVNVHGGSHGGHDWRSIFHASLPDILASIDMKLPDLPHPGDKDFPDIADLITLTSFKVVSENKKLVLHGAATVVNPAPPSLKLTAPSIPFDVSIPDTSDSPDSVIDVAHIKSRPFTFTRPNITILLDGVVPPISPNAFTVISQFVKAFLDGHDNKVIISSPLAPEVKVEAKFPAPNPRPKILKNVTISEMHIRAVGSSFVASGTVHARAVLPQGIGLGLDVKRILPDVLVFDGEVPFAPTAGHPDWEHPKGHGVYFVDQPHHRHHHQRTRPTIDPPPPTNDTAPPPPEMPLPDPLPERAFGHIRPEGWLLSVSERVEPEEGEGAAYAVTADVIDVPVEVLPGRQKQFSNFVTKVIFGSGATAGILGNAAVSVQIKGLPLNGPSSEIVVNGLPFRGRVHVGLGK